MPLALKLWKPEKNGNYVSCINTLLNMGSILSSVNRDFPPQRCTPGGWNPEVRGLPPAASVCEIPERGSDCSSLGHRASLSHKLVGEMQLHDWPDPCDSGLTSGRSSSP